MSYVLSRGSFRRVPDRCVESQIAMILLLESHLADSHSPGPLCVACYGLAECCQWWLMCS